MSCASRSGFIARASGLTAVALVASFACSTPTETQPFPGACEPLSVVEWTPSAGALEVPRDTPVTIRLDDYPDPDTVGTRSFLVTTGVFYHGGTYVTDLIEKTIAMHAGGNLRADLGYHVVVYPTLLSLRGCPAVEVRHRFRSGPTTALPPPTKPVAIPFSEVQPLVARSCAGAGCHRGEGDGCLEHPAAALSLCDRDAVSALVDVPSRQVSRLRLVAPNDSTRSYLLRKLLPGDTPDRPAPTTLGQRCPPGAPLSREELHAIAEWIDTGANP
jgi:hypothetical protein